MCAFPSIPALKAEFLFCTLQFYPIMATWWSPLPLGMLGILFDTKSKKPLNLFIKPEYSTMSVRNLKLKLVLENINSILNKSTSVSEAEFDLFIAQILQMRAKKVAGKINPNQETLKTFELTDKGEGVTEVENLNDFFTEINTSANNA